MSLEIDIAIEADAWAGVADVEAVVRRSLDAVVAMAGPEAADAEVSVLLCDDATIRILNRDWRGQDKPTNVLSFPAAAGGPPGGPRLLGDIAVAFETVQREARADDKPLAAHLAHLVVHGGLHLLGHDHEIDDDAIAMETLETRVMARLGLPDPYAGSDPERAQTG